MRPCDIRGIRRRQPRSQRQRKTATAWALQSVAVLAGIEPASAPIAAPLRRAWCEIGAIFKAAQDTSRHLILLKNATNTQRHGSRFRSFAALNPQASSPYPSGRGMPAFCRHLPLNVSPELHWARSASCAVCVPLPVAPPARGRNIDCRVRATVLSSHQVLGRRPQIWEPCFRDTERGGEAILVGLLPNRKAAVNAAALLREEGSGTEFGQS